MYALKDFTFSKRFPELPLIAAAYSEKHPDLIPLSFGYPARESFAIAELSASAVSALEAQGPESLGYMGGNGPKIVSEWIQQRSKLRSIEVDYENILVTSGSNQAIDLVIRTLTDPGDHVWIEAPTFFGAIRIFSLAETQLTSFPIDENGLRVDLVEEALADAKQNGRPLPKVFYVIPNFHNPGGINLAVERRKRLAELAYEYNFYIIEDDAYVELTFHHDYLPSIYSFGPERVVYLSTFSKTVGPGLRMGWAIGSPAVLNKMKMLKSDGSTSVFVQEIVGQFLTNVDFENHLNRMISLYTKRRNAMVDAIDNFFDHEVSYILPEGGFFLWMTFPPNVDTSTFLQAANRNGVSYIDGKHFYLHNDELNHIRLCFTYCDEQQISRGIKRIADAYFESTVTNKVLREV